MQMPKPHFQHMSSGPTILLLLSKEDNDVRQQRTANGNADGRFILEILSSDKYSSNGKIIKQTVKLREPFNKNILVLNSFL